MPFIVMESVSSDLVGMPCSQIMSAFGSYIDLTFSDSDSSSSDNGLRVAGVAS